MKTFATIALSTSLFITNAAQAADPMTELAAFATEQLTVQAIELKKNIADQIQQSLSQSLTEAVAEDVETNRSTVVASVKKEQDKVQEL